MKSAVFGKEDKTKRLEQVLSKYKTPSDEETINDILNSSPNKYLILNNVEIYKAFFNYCLAKELDNILEQSRDSTKVAWGMVGVLDYICSKQSRIEVEAGTLSYFEFAIKEVLKHFKISNVTEDLKIYLTGCLLTSRYGKHLETLEFTDGDVKEYLLKA